MPGSIIVLDVILPALAYPARRTLTHNARRIAALLLIEPALDRNYTAVKAATASWSDFGAAR